jgi:hypothetical protein
LSQTQLPQTQQASGAQEAKLEATVQVLTFEPGLYAVELLASQVGRGAGGFTLPCARIDPIEGDLNTPSRVYVSSLAEGNFIRPGQHPTQLLVERGVASVLLTVYKIAGAMAPPELRMRRMQAPLVAAAPKLAPGLPSLPLALLAHVERAGDVRVAGGHWAGEPGAGATVEGFSVSLEGALQNHTIEYQARLGIDWETPWAKSGEFCGSRGMSLPLIGVRFRLTGADTDALWCQYWGSFIGFGEVGPFEDGALCAGGGATLEALRLIISARPAPQASGSPSTRAKVTKPSGRRK